MKLAKVEHYLLPFDFGPIELRNGNFKMSKDRASKVCQTLWGRSIFGYEWEIYHGNFSNQCLCQKATSHTVDGVLLMQTEPEFENGQQTQTAYWRDKCKPPTQKRDSPDLCLVSTVLPVKLWSKGQGIGLFHCKSICVFSKFDFVVYLILWLVHEIVTLIKLMYCMSLNK